MSISESSTFLLLNFSGVCHHSSLITFGWEPVADTGKENSILLYFLLGNIIKKYKNATEIRYELVRFKRHFGLKTASKIDFCVGVSQILV